FQPGPATSISSLGDGAPFLLLQQAPHDLAGRRLGQRLDEFDHLRALVGRHLLLAPGEDLLAADLLMAAGAHRDRLDRLAPAWMWRRDDAHLAQRRMAVHQRLDLRRPDLVAGGVDHSLDPIDQKEITLFVVVAQVAGTEETLA